MKYIFALFLCLIATSAFAGEWWVDPSLEKHGNGSEALPFASMAPIDTAITPGAVHTIHLIHRPGYKFQGGLGGISLRYWIYGNCTIIKHGPVQFEPARSIPFAEWNDGPDGTRFVHINPAYDMKATRPYVDMDEREVLFTRPIYLGDKRTLGFEWDKTTRKLTVTPALLMEKVAHTARVACIKAKKQAWKDRQDAIAEVATNTDLLDQIEVTE